VLASDPIQLPVARFIYVLPLAQTSAYVTASDCGWLVEENAANFSNGTFFLILRYTNKFNKRMGCNGGLL